MKNLILSFSLIFTGALFAQESAKNYYQLTADNNQFTATNVISNDIISSYDGFDGEIFKFDNTQSKNVTVGIFSKDFTFNSGILLNTSATAGTANNGFFINNGATVTVNKAFQYNIKAKTRFWVDCNDGKQGTIIFNAPFERNASAENASLNASEMFINNANVIYNANIDIGYTSLYGGSTLTVKKDSSAHTFALRAANPSNTFTSNNGNVAYTKSLPTVLATALSGKNGVRDNGTLILDGASFEIKNPDTNAKSDEPDFADYAHIFTVKFAQSDVSESLISKNLHTYMTVKENSAGMDAILFEDMAFDDKIYTNTDLDSDAFASKIYINGVNILDLLGDGSLVESNDETYSHIYTFVAIPEPSTYAIFAGLIALGVAVYRRRK